MFLEWWVIVSVLRYWYWIRPQIIKATLPSEIHANLMDDIQSLWKSEWWPQKFQSLRKSHGWHHPRKFQSLRKSKRVNWKHFSHLYWVFSNYLLLCCFWHVGLWLTKEKASLPGVCDERRDSFLCKVKGAQRVGKQIRTFWRLRNYLLMGPMTTSCLSAVQKYIRWKAHW